MFFKCGSYKKDAFKHRGINDIKMGYSHVYDDLAIILI